MTARQFAKGTKGSGNFVDVEGDEDEGNDDGGGDGDWAGCHQRRERGERLGAQWVGSLTHILGDIAEMEAVRVFGELDDVDGEECRDKG
ncbi:hypothetical protein FOPE_12700 [Fonsecaea pedrosoi]|nr:hypothetical protein FOPE_12700 [Fonsecaea pedrosoi]